MTDWNGHGIDVTRVFMVMTPTGPHAQFGCVLVPTGGKPMDKFWMVWKVGGGYPMARHTTAKAAADEAERLTRKEGRAFVVLEAMAVCEPVEPAVKWHRMST